MPSREIIPYPVRKGLPFQVEGLPFQAVGLPFQAVGLPFQAEGLPYRNEFPVRIIIYFLFNKLY